MSANEISNQYKIILIITIVISLVYGILYTFFWWWWLPSLGYETFYPTGLTPRGSARWVGILFLSGILGIGILLKNTPWEKAEIFLQFMMGMLLIQLLYLAYELIFVFIPLGSSSSFGLIDSIIGNSLTIILLILNIIFYLKERKKHK